MLESYPASCLVGLALSELPCLNCVSSTDSPSAYWCWKSLQLLVEACLRAWDSYRLDEDESLDEWGVICGDWERAPGLAWCSEHVDGAMLIV